MHFIQNILLHNLQVLFFNNCAFGKGHSALLMKTPLLSILLLLLTNSSNDSNEFAGQLYGRCKCKISMSAPLYKFVAYSIVWSKQKSIQRCISQTFYCTIRNKLNINAQYLVFQAKIFRIKMVVDQSQFPWLSI